MPDENSDENIETAKMNSGGVLMETFAFGDSVSTVTGRDLWGYFEGMWRNGDYYEPPLPFTGLAKSFRMAPHHESAVRFKVNQLNRHFIPSKWMDAETHHRIALDLIQMGNIFIEEIPNRLGKPMAYRHALALHMRVGVEAGRYFWVKPEPTGFGGSIADHEFTKGTVTHIMVPDIEQEIYGLPEWLSALQSGLLNESATLFRRRYFDNGAHAGFVFYLSDPNISEKDANAIREQLKAAKGVGNFKNLFIHSPDGKKDGVQIMPIAEVAAKDEFLGIKNMTQQDILSVHRLPPQVLGIIPQNNGGFGDVRSAMDVVFENEIMPIMTMMRQINDRVGLPVITYRDYSPMQGAG